MGRWTTDRTFQFHPEHTALLIALNLFWKFVRDPTGSFLGLGSSNPVEKRSNLHLQIGESFWLLSSMQMETMLSPKDPWWSLGWFIEIFDASLKHGLKYHQIPDMHSSYCFCWCDREDTIVSDKNVWHYRFHYQKPTVDTNIDTSISNLALKCEITEKVASFNMGSPKNNRA